MPTFTGDITVREEAEYQVWEVGSDGATVDILDDETIDGVLVDQTAEGAGATIRSKEATNWELRNVGFRGLSQRNDGRSAGFNGAIGVGAGGVGRIENIYMNHMADGSQYGIGGIWLRKPHAGRLDLRHSYIEGFGNNALYGSNPGKATSDCSVRGSDGQVTVANAYHANCAAGLFRIGTPNSSVRNCVAVADDPAPPSRAEYPGGGYTCRPLWGKHHPGQLFENCSVYINPDDTKYSAAFDCRYIAEPCPDGDGVRSNGPYAEVDARDCRVNEGVPVRNEWDETDRTRIEIDNLRHDPTVEVIEDGGVPLSPEMAARGDRQMPDPLPNET